MSGDISAQFQTKLVKNLTTDTRPAPFETRCSNFCQFLADFPSYETQNPMVENLEVSLSLVWDNILSKASQIADVGSGYDGAVPLMSHKPKTEGKKTAH